MTSRYASTLSTSDTAAPGGTKSLPCRYGDVMTAHMLYDEQLLMTALDAWSQSIAVTQVVYGWIAKYGAACRVCLAV